MGVGKVYTTFCCQGRLWKSGQLAWEDVIKNSIVFWVPQLNKLIAICLLGWATILLQVMVSSLMSYPSKGIGQTNYEFKGEKKGYNTLWSQFFQILSGSPKK